tara:strand:+ start:1609 stop:2208 length:600 start_codon:yes stop_codon:yes gene_type:complete
MKKQQKIQLSLISFGLILFFITYFYYPSINKNKALDNKSNVEDNVQDNVEFSNLEQSTTFENVEYKGLYDLDKPFKIKSDSAYILNEDPDLVYMKNMRVILYLDDDRIVNITSNKGRYNKVTYDCFFEENVVASDGNTKIFSENMDLLATENTASIYNNVRLDNPEGNLLADIVNYDFNTKNFKVSMFDGETVQMQITQ